MAPSKVLIALRVRRLVLTRILRALAAHRPMAEYPERGSNFWSQLGIAIVTCVPACALACVLSCVLTCA